ncbi:MAG: class I SAM-dependent methyltransferase [Candidatus Omnitrophota bacterium]|jgi:SAM-dependent methyltransferase
MQNHGLVCKICGNQGENKEYRVREMMFGSREVFVYFECSFCGCLQIKDIPADMSRYYPEDYYSFQEDERLSLNKPDSPTARFLRHKRTEYYLGGKSYIGRLVHRYKPAERQLVEYLSWLKKCNANLSSRILDVGSGRGRLLLELAWYGFRRLRGVDSFIESHILEGSVRIEKKEISAVSGSFDIIMLHHALEHMSEPAKVFSDITRLLTKDGCVLIRIPTVSSYAWGAFGVNWVQIDAPRHFFLFSLKNIETLARNSGLAIKEIEFDSTEFQFIGSLQYAQDIPLRDERSYCVNPQKSIFSAERIKEFQVKAVALNKERTGDQVCIYLTKQ